MKHHARVVDANLRRNGLSRRRHQSLRAEPLEPDLSPSGGGLQSLSTRGQSWDVGQSFDVLLAASTGRLSTLDGTTTATAAAANGLPDLHSLPRAPTAIYLDFDGNGSTLGAYDVDGDPATFNAAEAASITETHRQTSAYFAMFDLNVTTVKPTVPYAWIVISNDISGGSSYVGVFPNSKPESWVSSSVAESRVSGIAHELGHNFGLLHQAEYDLLGNKTSEYSNGYDSLHGSIMGVDYRQDVHKWFIGHPSNSASALQDDVAVIAGVIKKYQPAGGDGFRADDFGGTIATASALTATNGLRSAAHRILDVPIDLSTDGIWYVRFLTRRGPSPPRDEHRALVVLRTRGLATQEDIDQSALVQIAFRKHDGVFLRVADTITRGSLPQVADQTYAVVAKIVAGSSQPDQVLVSLIAADRLTGSAEPTEWSLVSEDVDSDHRFDKLSLEFTSGGQIAIGDLCIGPTRASVAQPLDN